MKWKLIPLDRHKKKTYFLQKKKKQKGDFILFILDVMTSPPIRNIDTPY